MLKDLDVFFKGLVTDEYVSGRQLAKIMGISQTTLIRLRKEGKSPSYIVVGKRAKYPRDAVLGWLRKHVCIDVPAYRRRTTHDEGSSE